MKNNKIFMAFAGGKESTEGSVVKRYIGVAPVFVVAVNPTKEELGVIYEADIEKDPEYVGETEIGSEGNKTKVPQVRLDFILHTDAEKSNGIDIKTKVSFFIANSVRYNRDSTKVQVINKYGKTTWLTIEDAKAGRIPENLNWFEAADFRPAYIGEEELTGFIKAYLNIPNKSYKKASGEVIELENKADAEARLDCIASYFKGDYKELQNILKLQPNNKVKCMFGVRNTDDNKQYQAIYTQKFLKNNITNYSNLDKDLQERKANGSYPNTEFSTCPLKEYVIEETNFDASEANTTEASDNSPWGFSK